MYHNFHDTETGYIKCYDIIHNKYYVQASRGFQALRGFRATDKFPFEIDEKEKYIECCSDEDFRGAIDDQILNKIIYKLL
jgi:hypothetical protein